MWIYDDVIFNHQFSFHMIISFNINTENIMIFWDITPCSLENVLTYQRNMSPPSSGSMNKPSNKPAWSSACYLLHGSFLFGLFFDAEDGGWHVPPTYQLIFCTLHGIISQETELFITTAVRPSKKKRGMLNLCNCAYIIPTG
jgi:hypothetical protein